MPVKKRNSLLIVFIVGCFLLLLYFTMNFSICSQLNAKNDFFTNFSDAVDATLTFRYSPLRAMEDDIDRDKLLGNIGLSVFLYVLFALYFFYEQQKRAHFQKDIACGSAKWNDDLDSYNKVYTDPPGSKDSNGPNNLVLTEDVKLNMDTRATRRNNNITVVGGSGSGKSRFFVKPNILQANSNYVITDPSGELLEATGSFLEEQGYTIKVFNLVEMAKSNCYNPFDYIRDDLGVVMMIKCLIKNTTPPGQKGGDPFWEKSEEALLQAISFYLIEARPKKDRNFSTVMKLLRCAEVNEQDPSAESELDKLFKAHEAENPKSLAVKQYKIFKMGAGKTLKSILISCSVRLTVFNLEQIASLTRSDDENGIELEKMGDGKKALFVIIPSADSTYNFLVSMMYSQLFETLYFVAETQKAGKRLESPVRFLLDEFANIGEIPEFTKKLATMRKYEISCSIILQNLAQIKTMYKDDWQTILGNCDSFLFLGGQEYETVEYISKELGNATIVVQNDSLSNGKGSSHSYNTSKRELMTPDELMKLDNNECILLIRGLNPFRGRKCIYENCKNYKYTADADKSKKYKLTIMNQVCMTKDEVDALRERFFAKAASAKSKRSQLIGNAQPLETALQDAGVKNADDVSLVAPAPINEANRKYTYKVPSNSKPQSGFNSAENKSLASESDGNTVTNVVPTYSEVENRDELPASESISRKNDEEDNNAAVSKENEGNFINITKSEEDLDEWEV